MNTIRVETPPGALQPLKIPNVSASVFAVSYAQKRKFNRILCIAIIFRKCCLWLLRRAEAGPIQHS